MLRVELVEQLEAGGDRGGQELGVVPADREHAQAGSQVGCRTELGAEAGELGVAGRGGDDPLEHLGVAGHGRVEQVEPVVGRRGHHLVEACLDAVEPGGDRVEPLDRRPQGLVDRLLVGVQPLDARRRRLGPPGEVAGPAGGAPLVSHG